MGDYSQAAPPVYLVGDPKWSDEATELGQTSPVWLREWMSLISLQCFPFSGQSLEWSPVPPAGPLSGKGNLRRHRPLRNPRFLSAFCCRCSLWLMSGTWGCKLETPHATDKYPLWMVHLRMHYTSWLLATSTQAVQSQSLETVRLYVLSDACNKPQSPLEPMLHLGP